LSVSELATALDDRFTLLNRGRRTALPRHRTLRATLDWSYNLLRECDAIVLQRLSVFAGAFTLESAGVIAARGDLASFNIINSISDLVARSLVSADGRWPVTRSRSQDAKAKAHRPRLRARVCGLPCRDLEWSPRSGAGAYRNSLAAYDGTLAGHVARMGRLLRACACKQRRRPGKVRSERPFPRDRIVTAAERASRNIIPVARRMWFSPAARMDARDGVRQSC
jgi:hypothetical protein